MVVNTGNIIKKLDVTLFGEKFTLPVKYDVGDQSGDIAGEDTGGDAGHESPQPVDGEQHRSEGAQAGQALDKAGDAEDASEEGTGSLAENGCAYGDGDAQQRYLKSGRTEIAQRREGHENNERGEQRKFGHS